MRANHYRHQLQLQSPVRTRSADTGETLTTWQNVGQPFRAAIQTKAPAEVIHADIGHETFQTHDITLQASSRSQFITNKDRFLATDGTVFHIISRPGERTSGRSRQLVFSCKSSNEQ